MAEKIPDPEDANRPTPRVQFGGLSCWPVWGRYGNGRIALTLHCWDPDEGFEEPMATVSVNLEDDLPAGHMFVKTWSENGGILEACIEAGLVQDTGRSVRAGHTYAALVKVLVPVPEASR